MAHSLIAENLTKVEIMDHQWKFWIAVKLKNFHQKNKMNRLFPKIKIKLFLNK